MIAEDVRRPLKFILFLLVQTALFCAIVLTGASPLWVPVLAIFAVGAMSIAAARWHEAGVHSLRIFLSFAGWCFFLTFLWFAVFLLCANAKGLFGWVFAGILFSLPLGMETSGLLLALSLVATPKSGETENETPFPL